MFEVEGIALAAACASIGSVITRRAAAVEAAAESCKAENRKKDRRDKEKMRSAKTFVSLRASEVEINAGVNAILRRSSSERNVLCQDPGEAPLTRCYLPPSV